MVSGEDWTAQTETNAYLDADCRAQRTATRAESSELVQASERRKSSRVRQAEVALVHFALSSRLERAESPGCVSGALVSKYVASCPPQPSPLPVLTRRCLPLERSCLFAAELSRPHRRNTPERLTIRSLRLECLEGSGITGRFVALGESGCCRRLEGSRRDAYWWRIVERLSLNCVQCWGSSWAWEWQVVASTQEQEQEREHGRRLGGVQLKRRRPIDVLLQG